MSEAMSLVTMSETQRMAPRIGEASDEGGLSDRTQGARPRRRNAHVLLVLAGWGDLPGELHREILRLVPLRDATAARGLSQEMRDEVDEVWRAWGIRASAADLRTKIRSDFIEDTKSNTCSPRPEVDGGPLAVYASGGSHAHHLASMGLGWLALVVVREAGEADQLVGLVGSRAVPANIAGAGAEAGGARGGQQGGVGVRAGGRGVGAAGAGGGGDGG